MFHCRHLRALVLFPLPLPLPSFRHLRLRSLPARTTAGLPTASTCGQQERGAVGANQRQGRGWKAGGHGRTYSGDHSRIQLFRAVQQKICISSSVKFSLLHSVFCAICPLLQTDDRRKEGDVNSINRRSEMRSHMCNNTPLVIFMSHLIRSVELFHNIECITSIESMYKRW